MANKSRAPTRVFVTDSRIHRLIAVTFRVTALRNRNASAMPDATRNHGAHDYAECIHEEPPCCSGSSDSLAIACILLFTIGTALGSKTRQKHEPGL